MREKRPDPPTTTTTTTTDTVTMKPDTTEEEQRLRDRLIKRRSSNTSTTTTATNGGGDGGEKNHEKNEPDADGRRPDASPNQDNHDEPKGGDKKNEDDKKNNKRKSPDRQDNEDEDRHRRRPRRDDNRGGHRNRHRHPGHSPPPPPPPNDRHPRQDRRRGSNGSQGGRGGGRGPPPPFPPPGHHNRRGPPPPGPTGHWRGRGRGPPPPPRGPPLPPPGYYDDFGRHRRPSASPSPPPPARGRGRGRSPSWSRSRSRSRSPRSDSYSRDGSVSDDSRRGGSRRRRERSRSRSWSSSRSGGSRSRSRSPRRGRRGASRDRRRRSNSVSSASSRSSYDSRSSRSSVDSRRDAARNDAGPKDAMSTLVDTYSKDQRTVFVSQLVMRATERDLRKYFSRFDIPINEIEFMRDKRMRNKHKGCAYVELRRMEDVPRAVALSGQPPDFQRFPLLIKASEAEKNYVASASQATVTVPSQSGPVVGPDGKLIEAQKVYVGGLDHSVTQEHLFALFQPFGQLEKVAVQMDTSTGLSKGFAFLSFRDASEAYLAIQTMSGRILAGRPLKTGWANHVAPHAGVRVVQSDQFPPDATERAQRAYQVLAQLTLGVAPTASVGLPNAAAVPTMTHATPAVAAAATGGIPTVAQARASLAAAAAATNPVMQPHLLQPQQQLLPQAAPAESPQAVTRPPGDPEAFVVGNADKPSCNLLIHNMFDKDQETEPGWDKEIEEELVEESAQYGKIVMTRVMSTEPGGKIYARFETEEGADKCARSLAGRWFDKRQLRVEFVSNDDFDRIWQEGNNQETAGAAPAPGGENEKQESKETTTETVG